MQESGGDSPRKRNKAVASTDPVKSPEGKKKAKYVTLSPEEKMELRIEFTLTRIVTEVKNGKKHPRGWKSKLRAKYHGISDWTFRNIVSGKAPVTSQKMGGPV